jgi:Met-zincin
VQLGRIASRSAERELAYGTDEDNFLGIDPEALQWDLGSDSLAFAQKRIAIANELFRRQESRALPADRDYTVLRRSLAYAVNDAGHAVGVLTRQIGGVRTLRDFPGSGRDPLQPVPPATQRAALDVIAKSLLAADAFVVSPALQRRLAPDFQARGDALFAGDGGVATDFSLTQRVLAVQRALLGQLMSDGVAARILDSQGKAERPRHAFQLTELYGRLERSVWSELGSRGVAPAERAVVRDIPAPRRELQREYLNRLGALLLRPAGGGRSDARSLVRAQSLGLLARLQAAGRRPDLGADTRAHLQDCAATLAQALNAPVVRLGA